VRRGYQPRQADAASGVIVVPARYVARWGRTSSLRVVCYLDGSVEVVPQGQLVREGRRATTAPQPLQQEAMALAEALAEELGPPAGMSLRLAQRRAARR